MADNSQATLRKSKPDAVQIGRWRELAHRVHAAGLACLLAAGLAACAPPAPQPSLTRTVLVTILPTATGIATPLPPTPTPTPAPTPTPLPPQPITMALIGEPESLHPLYGTSPAAQAVLAALFVGCVGQDDTGAPTALGCERVPSLENGDARFVGEGDDRHLEVTFRIRPGWRWTDGTPVTAQDAVYAWQLIMSPEAQLRDPLAQKVYAMTAADDRTIVARFMSAAQARAAAAGALRGDVPFEYFSQLGDYARFKEQAGPVGDALYWAVARWLPAHRLRDVPAREQPISDFAARPVGDGAFELVDWERGTRITLARSPLSFPLEPAGDAPGTISGTLPGTIPGTIPGIIFEFVPDEAAAVRLVQSDRAQLGSPVSVESAGVSAESWPWPVFEQLVMNVDRPPLDDVRVRQAVRQALDPQAILGDPNAAPITRPLTLNPAGALRGLPAQAFEAGGNLARAKALLAEAGWQCDTTPCTKPITQPDGTVTTQPLEFVLVTNERAPRNALSQLVQKQLSAAGFGVDLAIVHGLGRNSKLFAPYEQGGLLMRRNFDAALFQAPSLITLAGVFDCAGIPTERSHASSQGNAAGLCNPDIDALIAELETGEASVSDAERIEVARKVIAGLSEAAPVVALYSPVRALPAASNRIAGLRYRGIGPVTWNAWEWRWIN